MSYYKYDAVTGVYLGWQDTTFGISNETQLDPPLPVPNGVATFRNGAWTVAIPPESIAKLNADVNIERARRFSSLVVIVNAIPYDADDASIANIMAILVASGAGIPVGWPISWRDHNNVSQSLDQTAAVTLAGTVFGAKDILYKASWHLKDVVIPSLLPDQFASFDVTNDAHWQ